MAEATFCHLTSPAFVTGIAVGAASAALYVRFLHFPALVYTVLAVFAHHFSATFHVMEYHDQSTQQLQNMYKIS